MFTNIRKPITKVLVNFEVNKCKNFVTFKTFLVILNYENFFFNYGFLLSRIFFKTVSWLQVEFLKKLKKLSGRLEKHWIKFVCEFVAIQWHHAMRVAFWMGQPSIIVILGSGPRFDPPRRRVNFFIFQNFWQGRGF